MSCRDISLKIKNIILIVAIYPIAVEKFHLEPKWMIDQLTSWPAVRPTNWHYHPYSHTASIALRNVVIISFVNCLNDVAKSKSEKKTTIEIQINKWAGEGFVMVAFSNASDLLRGLSGYQLYFIHFPCDASMSLSPPPLFHWLLTNRWNYICPQLEADTCPRQTSSQPVFKLMHAYRMSLLKALREPSGCAGYNWEASTMITRRILQPLYSMKC